MAHHQHGTATQPTAAEEGLEPGARERHAHLAPSGLLATLTPSTLLRAGAVAAVLSIGVSGGAYAAIQQNGPGEGANGAAPLPVGASLPPVGATGTPSPAADSDDTATPSAAPTEDTGLTVDGQTTTVTTQTLDETQAHSRVEKETDTLPKGETKVETQGVDGVTRTTYRVTWADNTEISREAVSTVVVTKPVDEVVLVGTADPAPAPAAAPSSSSSSSSDSSGTAAPTPQYASGGTTAGDAQAVARSMMGSYGWGEGEFSCLVSLWNRESGWNYQAENPSSGAYGIPQALPGSKMVSAGSDWATNPVTQITWGLGYIAGRYGSPCGAWAHSEATGWY